MLNRLEPNEFPIANSGLFSRAATADEKISGADVPKATTVRPIINGDTPKFCAKPDAPSTNLSAPRQKKWAVAKLTFTYTCDQILPKLSNLWLENWKGTRKL